MLFFIYNYKYVEEIKNKNVFKHIYTVQIKYICDTNCLSITDSV